MRVLGIDPGFAALGWARAETGNGFLAFTDLGALFTKKDPDRSAAHDLFERCQGLALDLSHLGTADILCVEGMSFPRNASSAMKLGASHAIIATLVETSFFSKVVLCSPWQARKTLTGLAKPTEEEAHEALVATYPEVADITRDFKKKQLPHALDAAVQVAAWWKNKGLGL